MSTETDKHYQQTCPRCDLRLDPYRIMEIYDIEEYPIAHAIKKLLRAGKGSKNLAQDIDGAILTLQRYREMTKEDMSIWRDKHLASYEEGETPPNIPPDYPPVISNSSEPGSKVRFVLENYERVGVVKGLKSPGQYEVQSQDGLWIVDLREEAKWRTKGNYTSISKDDLEWLSSFNN